MLLDMYKPVLDLNAAFARETARRHPTMAEQRDNEVRMFMEHRLLLHMMIDREEEPTSGWKRRDLIRIARTLTDAQLLEVVNTTCYADKAAAAEHEIRKRRVFDPHIRKA